MIVEFGMSWLKATLWQDLGRSKDSRVWHELVEGYSLGGSGRIWEDQKIGDFRMRWLKAAHWEDQKIGDS